MIGMRGLALISTIAISQALAGAGLAGEPASQPTSRSRPAATQPQGRWSFWADCSGANVLAADEQSIWFGCQDAMWRYDVKARKIAAFSPLDGLPLADPNRSGILDDGRFVCEYDQRHLAWDSRTGWQRLADLPDSGGSGYVTQGLAPTGRLLAMVNADQSGKRKVLEYGETGWQPIGQMPTARFVMPVDDGFYAQLEPDRTSPPHALSRRVFVSANLTKTRDYPFDTYTWDNNGTFTGESYRVKGQTFALFRGNESPIRGRPPTVAFLITPDKVSVAQTADCIGLDFRGG
jgi:hypothetical protein